MPLLLKSSPYTLSYFIKSFLILTFQLMIIIKVLYIGMVL